MLRKGERPRVIVLREKSPEIAALLAFIFLGLGHIYVGRIGKGIAILVLGNIAIGTCVLLFLLFFWLVPLVVVLLAVPLIVWIWQIYDAFRLAKKYNTTLLSVGRPPW